MTNQSIVAIEIGGTNMKAVAFDADTMPITPVYKRPTATEQGPEYAARHLRELMTAVTADLANREVAPLAVGCAAKGPLDTADGRLLARSIPGLFNFDLATFLREEFGLDLFLENNANCFALAEALRGAGVKERIVLGINLGTGLGCGIVIDGKIVSGTNGNAGELEWCTHSRWKYDEILSGRGPARIYELNKGLPPYTTETQVVANLARDGDEIAIRVWTEYGKMLGEALGKIVAVLDPGIVVLGGAGTAQFDLFGKVLNQGIGSQVAPSTASRLKIVQTALGNRAGLIGAALLVGDMRLQRSAAP